MQDSKFYKRKDHNELIFYGILFFATMLSVLVIILLTSIKDGLVFFGVASLMWGVTMPFVYFPIPYVKLSGESIDYDGQAIHWNSIDKVYFAAGSTNRYPCYCLIKLYVNGKCLKIHTRYYTDYQDLRETLERISVQNNLKMVKEDWSGCNG